ncbi:uncharacterized protein C8Q71DRAFT_256675 [Rhodofomes roseus]|uniref:Transmembrane protein n=1 Tax=Rhodofomes roseus TaxID=34475 RepID=A0ABQ8K796_9APHY|nr:uncharacterized protein C8Q71DRAFT_256675 [Rhodofomes roseus]KAH9832514.1 hypothetical protein C8Q71DRAFT_256675 [Rhodofomes roseus]
MLVGPPARCWLLVCTTVVLSLRVAVRAENVTIQSTAPEIVYSPPACNASTSSCDSAWQVLASPDNSSALVTSTSGPTNGSAALVPQLFLTFTGSTLYIRTSTASTALVNVSLATHDPAFAITARVDTAAAGGLITVVDLPSDRATTLTVSFVPSDDATLLEIANFTIVTTGNDSPFSSSPLPSTTAIPTFSPIISPAATSQATSKQTRDDIIAEVLGAVLGVALCLFAAAGFLFWRKRRRKQLRTRSPQTRTPGD